MIRRTVQVLASLVLLLALAVGPQCNCAHATAPASASASAPDHPCCARDRAPASGDDSRQPTDESTCPHCADSAAAQTSRVEINKDVARAVGPTMILGVNADPRADLAGLHRQVPGHVPLDSAGGPSLLALHCTLLI